MAHDELRKGAIAQGGFGEKRYGKFVI